MLNTEKQIIQLKQTRYFSKKLYNIQQPYEKMLITNHHKNLN